MSSNESKIPVGTLLVGKYRVAREIGRGGMAAVYEAEQLSLGKRVAVKVLASELAASTIVIERFFREARAAASVKSPYIVDVYDSGRLDDGRPFIAMEMLEGESLYDRMARVRIIDPETTMRVVVHTARGLVKAHAAGIVHRDLKPENIFLTKGEEGGDICKILDFGLAKFYAPVNPEDKAQKRLTREGAVFGTPAYMSPEQVKGQGNVDHRADLWALGCMAYECLIGRPVWNMDQGVAMTFASIATGPIPVPSQARPDLPPSFDVWFKRCLERDPERRYQSAKELADAYVEAWGGQRQQSSASYPSMASSGSGRHVPVQIGASGSADAPDLYGPPSTGRRSPPNSARGHDQVSSDASFPLVQQRGATDVASTSDLDAPQRRRTSPLRLIASALFFGGSVTAAIVVWINFVTPQVFTPVVQSSASANNPNSAPVGSGQDAPTSSDQPAWGPTFAEGQRLFTEGKPAEAIKKLHEATSMGQPAASLAKSLIEQMKVASAQTDGACQTVAFARPRMAADKRAERPTIRATPKGMLVAWTDDHEVKDKDHVYGVMLDFKGAALGPIRDLTPEASDAQRPHLTAPSHDSERSVLLYSDKAGRDAGVRVRFLDGDGRIDSANGTSKFVGAARSGDFWPVIHRGPKGFFVAWQDDRDKDKDFDIFARELDNDLETVGPETRLTDYYAAPKSKTTTPRARFPSVAVAANTLFVAYRLEKDKEKERLIMRLRVPLAELAHGLEESKEVNRTSRELGDAALVSEDKAPADAPAMACGTEGCFVVWNGEPHGAFVAFIDPNVGKVQWRKKFSDRGGRPSIAVNDGRVAVTYYEPSREGWRIKLAFLSRDGVSTPSVLGRVVDPSSPRPSLAGGAQKLEWILAWQDVDVAKGPPGIYAARVLCR